MPTKNTLYFHNINDLCHLGVGTSVKRLTYTFIVCPNPDCNKYTLTVLLYNAKEVSGYGDPQITTKVKLWQLIPESRAIAFEGYDIPQAIIDDYNEACLICDLSPKASATLSRRCIQGMIRDFWEIEKNNLYEEIKELEGKIDTSTWAAIDAVRKIGNIGAHMEKDIDLIIDVEPDEAILLVELIETLIQDWYIAKAEREARLKKIADMVERKGKARTGLELEGENDLN